MTERMTTAERRALILDAAPDIPTIDRAELSLLVELLGNASTWAEPDPGFEDAVVRAVTDVSPLERSHRVRTPGRRDAKRRRPRVFVSASVAAAAIAVIMAIVLTGGTDTRPGYRAQLVATGLAPHAHAAVDITRTTAGFHISLDAHGLPALRSGEYYQAWLKNAADTLVPVGTFSSSDGRVTLWSGASPKDFPTMTVTIESTDDEQASSGRRVLVGELHSP